MTVIVLQRVPTSLRGQLSRWCIEVRSGVFVGVVSQSVREALWGLIVADLRDQGTATMVWAARTEQRFKLRTAGDPTRIARDLDGLILLSIPDKS